MTPILLGLAVADRQIRSAIEKGGVPAIFKKITSRSEAARSPELIALHKTVKN